MLTVSLSGTSQQIVAYSASGFTLNGKPVDSSIESITNHTITIRIGGREHLATLQGWDWDKGVLRVKLNGKDVSIGVKTREDQLLDLLGIDRAALLKVAELKAPMPGLVRRIVVSPGQSVQAGDPLLVLEAMKMENVLKAPAPATVTEVCVTEGTAVEKGAVLVKFG
jgi:biotin carboxyl carrier protein